MGGRRRSLAAAAIEARTADEETRRAVRVLMVGDVVGRPGRHALATILPDLRKELALDFAIVQGENIAAGFGLTLDTVKELLSRGGRCRHDRQPRLGPQ